MYDSGMSSKIWQFWYGFPPQQGWECPKCGRVYSPTQDMCLFCGMFDIEEGDAERLDEILFSDNTTTISKPYDDFDLAYSESLFPSSAGEGNPFE